LASTRLVATVLASSPGTPAASKRARAKSSSGSAAKVGTARASGRDAVAAACTIADGAPDGEGKSMTFQVRTETHQARRGWDGTVFVLHDAGNRAAVWPAFGFNGYSWQVTRAGQVLDLLYADPQLFNDSKPTRSGIPILFPFPNRIRDGRFTWEGKTYQ